MNAGLAGRGAVKRTTEGTLEILAAGVGLYHFFRKS
jgi:hypothetical protein